MTLSLKTQPILEEESTVNAIQENNKLSDVQQGVSCAPKNIKAHKKRNPGGWPPGYRS